MTPEHVLLKAYDMVIDLDKAGLSQDKVVEAVSEFILANLGVFFDEIREYLQNEVFGAERLQHLLIAAKVAARVFPNVLDRFQSYFTAGLFSTAIN